MKAFLYKVPSSRAWRGARSLRSGATALAFFIAALTDQALAQASSPSGGIGEQLNKLSAEGINSGGTMFGGFCYLAAAVCFAMGVWALWQSRSPQHRDGGYVARGAAGLALCGLFAGGGIWVNKAAVSMTGSAASISTTPQMVQFGNSTP